MTALRRVALWTDGTVRAVGPDEPVVTAFDQGLGRGDGVFESVLVTGGRTPHLDAHLTRLRRSAELLELTHPGEEAVRALVAAATEDRTLGVLGEPRVNVLRLNLTLDAEP